MERAMKRKILVASMIVLVMALPAAVSYAQEATEEAPIVEEGRRHPIRDIMHDVMDIVTEATGLSREEVRQQLRDGATLSEIITANGGDVEAIKAEVIALVTERIESAVTDGRLSRERADELLENLPARVDQLFDEVHDFEDRANRAERGLFAYLIQEIVDTTDLTRQEIVTQAQEGATLSEIIAENGGDVETIKASVLAELTERLDERVANGDLTQEEADTILSEASERLDGWLSGELEFPVFGEHGEGRGGRAGEGRGGRGN
jgi:hypothetical protein